MTKGELELFQKIIGDQTYSWSGHLLCGHEPYDLMCGRLNKLIPNKEEAKELKRINLFTYTAKNLEINFRLCYYNAYGNDNFDIENFFWLEFTVDDRLRRLGIKRYLDLSVEKGEENETLFLKSFNELANRAYVAPRTVREKIESGRTKPLFSEVAALL
jgi:hypothetical protein